MHTPMTESTVSEEREPDDSLPHDYKHAAIQSRSRAASRSLSTSPGKAGATDISGSDPSLDAVQFDSEESDISDVEAEDLAQSIATLRSTTPSYDTLENSYDSSALSVSPGENLSQPSSWSSTWSRESDSESQSPPEMTHRTPARNSRRRQSGTDSPIISSLKRSTSNFATTFSKPPVPVSVQDLRESLDDDGQASHRSRPSSREQYKPHDGEQQNTSRANDAKLPGQGQDRVPLATRKRFHRLESGSPRTTPTNSPQKSRALRAAKSRDKLRVRREDLDEYFPVTEDDVSTTASTTKGNVFADNRLPRPSLLNPDFPVQIPMPASLLQAGKSEFPTKNSLRRTMMSSRLRDRGLAGGSGSAPSSSRRPVTDRGFFTSNDYS